MVHLCLRKQTRNQQHHEGNVHQTNMKRPRTRMKTLQLRQHCLERFVRRAPHRRRQSSQLLRLRRRNAATCNYFHLSFKQRDECYLYVSQVAQRCEAPFALNTLTELFPGVDPYIGRMPTNGLAGGFVHCSRLTNMELHDCNPFGDFHLLPRSITDIDVSFIDLSDDGTARLSEFLINSYVSMQIFLL